MQSFKPFFALVLTGALALAGCLNTFDQEEAGSATMAPESSASMPLIVKDAPWDPETVTINVQEAAGLNVTPPEALHDTGNDTLAGWVMFEAPAGTENGEHEVVIAVENSEGESREFTYELSVEPPEEPIEEGDVASAHITARTQDGQLAFTTDEEIANSPLPHSESYQAGQQHEPIEVQVMHGGQLPDDIVDELLTSGAGHSFTMEIPDFFGAAITEEERPREDLVERMQQQQASHELPREQAEQQELISEDAEVGDPVEAPGLPFPFVIDEFKEGSEEQGGELVVIRADVEEGETVELQSVTVQPEGEQDMMMQQPQQLPYPSDPAWADAATVESVDEMVNIRIDPPYEVGESFTWIDGWDDATEIVHLDDDVIQLRHSPEEGMTFTEPPQQPGMEETEATVAAVGEENITIERDNPDPLGGELILLNFVIQDTGDAPDQQPGQPGQPGQPQ